MRLVAGAVLLFVAVAGFQSAHGITINITYDPTHPDSTGMFTPAEEAVIDQAASAWAAQIVSQESFNVTAVKSNLPASQGLLGLAKDYTSSGGLMGGLYVGTPTGGTILINDSVSFFIDSSPSDNIEFESTAPPATFLTAKSGSSAVGKFDLLTVALHEFGHILGIASAFESFALNVSPSPDTSQQVYVFGGVPILGDPVSDYRRGIFANGGVYLPPRDENSGEAGSVGGIPSHLDSVDRGGMAAGLFPLDLMNEGTGTGERRLISFVDLDILADAHGYSVVPEPTTVLLLGTGLLLLVGRRGLQPRA